MGTIEHAEHCMNEAMDHVETDADMVFAADLIVATTDEPIVWDWSDEGGIEFRLAA